MIGENKTNVINQIIGDFIESILKERPIGAFDLEFELKSFVYEDKIFDLKDVSENEFIIREFKRKEEETAESEEYLKDISRANNYDDFFSYLQSIEDPLIYYLSRQILKDERVKIVEPIELEEQEIDDVYTPNLWIFHNDVEYKQNIDYIIEFYDEMNREDQYPSNQY